MKVTYLGNEGFLVRSGSQAVLFDALFGAGLPDYDRVPADTVQAIETGQPPFDHINALFISHVHPDHFALASAVRFLKFHPTTVVVAPEQVSKQIRHALANHPQTALQVHTTFLQQGMISHHEEGGVPVGSFPLAHDHVENAAYLVMLNGHAILHFGDADLPMTGLVPLGPSRLPVDLAFVPYWQLTEDPKSVRNQIGARVIIPMHLIINPTTDSSKGYFDHVGGRKGMLRQIRSNFPHAAVFVTPLEKKTFE